MIASLSFSLDEGGLPLYLQLQQQLLTAIDAGRLQVGDKLPSSRQFAVALGVSRSVVVQTYDQLIAEGVLISAPKKGVFVADVQRVAPSQMATNARVLSSAEPLQFDSGADVTVFPSKAWAASMRRAWLNPDMNLLTGGYRSGFPPLQQAIVRYLYALRGLECLPEQIIITAGNRDALALLTHALEHDTKIWCVENPTYPPIRASLARYQMQHLPVTEHGASPPSTSLPWTAILTPNRQYPLGLSYSSPVREQWLDALAAQQGYVIEDDYDTEFLYQGKSSVPMMQLAQRRGLASERVFYIGSFSKVLFRGLRLGFIVAPVSQVSRLLQSQQLLGLSASLPIQPVVANFMENGSFYRHLNRMRRHYRHKREFLLDLLACHLTPWFEWEKPNAGMHVVAYLKSPWSVNVTWQKALTEACRAEALMLSWLSSHFAEGDVFKEGLVLGFTVLHENQMREAIRFIAKTAKALE